MRLTLTCAAIAACLQVAVAHPAFAGTKYDLVRLNRAAKLGGFSPSVLTDSGLAAGTLDLTAGGYVGYVTNGKTSSTTDYCANLGAPAQNTFLNSISPDAAQTYTAGSCSFQPYSFLYNRTTNTTTSVQVPYSGAIWTSAFAVNSNGVVAGEWANSTTHGFTLAGGTYTSIDIPSASFTNLYGVNAQNTTFGWYGTNPAGTTANGFLVTSGGSTTVIAYPNAVFTEIFSLNAQNMAVGGWGDASNNRHAYAWQNGTFLVPPIHDAVQSLAVSVNNEGDVSGWYETAASIAVGTNFGFVWNTATNTVIRIKPPRNANNFIPYAVNNTHAQIVGSYYQIGVGTYGFIGTCAGTSCF